MYNMKDLLIPFYGDEKRIELIEAQGFYDPVNERMIEPELTGFSYSFTKDGYYESAYYRAIANRELPPTTSKTF